MCRDPDLELTDGESTPLLEEGLDPAEWFTVRTLVNYWGVPRSVIHGAISSGKLPSVKYEKRLYFNKATVLVAWRPTMKAREKSKKLADYEGRPRGRGIELLAKLEENYLLALADNVTYEDWVNIVKTAVFAAKKGDWRSRKWLSDYLLGTPIHRVAAEVDLAGKQGYTDDQRAAAVTALLELVRSREDEVIDVDARPVGESNTSGESPS